MEGENLGRTGTSLHSRGLRAIGVCERRGPKDQISRSVSGSSDVGLGLATEEHTFSFVTLFDSLPFLAIFFFVICILK